MTAKILRPTFKTQSRAPVLSDEIYYEVPTCLAVMYSQYMKTKGETCESLEAIIRHGILTRQESVYVSDDDVGKCCRIPLMKMYAEIGMFFVPEDPRYKITADALSKIGGTNG